MISDRLDEVHARQVARTIDRQTTSNADVQPNEMPESGWLGANKNYNVTREIIYLCMYIFWIKNYRNDGQYIKTSYISEKYKEY